MLILLIRTVFVITAAMLGWVNSDFFTLGLADELPPWSGAVVGFAIAVTLIAAEQGFRRRFARSIVAVLIGVTGGLALSMLIIGAMSLVMHHPDAQRLHLPIAVIVTYLVVILVLQHRDRLRLIVPFAEFRADRIDGISVVVEPSALSDGRLRGLVEGGLVLGRVILHRSAIEYWEHQSRLTDPVAAARGRRALALVAALRELPDQRLEVDDSDIPEFSQAVDKAIHLARLWGSRLVTSEASIAERCKADGLRPLLLPELALSFVPSLRVGDQVRVLVSKTGENRNQGVGYLDDGSMVIVNGAGEEIGQEVNAQIARLHHGAHGRMLFCERAAS